MTEMGHKRTLALVRAMSALPPKADIRPRDQDVCFGPKRRHAVAPDLWLPQPESRHRPTRSKNGFNEHLVRKTQSFLQREPLVVPLVYSVRNL
jgi:hypothetical protein